MAEVPSTFQLGLGSVAPDFTLPDGHGNSLSLGEIKGDKGTLVIFACNHCPFVVHLAEAIAGFAAETAAKGVNTVAINSNDIENYPQDRPGKMVEFTGQYGWKFPYLFDQTQDVAKAYGAACTPDFYLFDDDLKLVYAGQFDSSRPRNGEPVTGESLRAAVSGLVDGSPPVQPQLPSSGCNIKWKPGNAPAYLG
jgi:peroxiredoxin